MRVKQIEINGNVEACKNINLILGANNSGKSTFIKELANAISSSNIAEQNKWIEKVCLEIANSKTKFDLLYPSVSSINDFQTANQEFGKDGKQNIYGNNNFNHVIVELLKEYGDQVKDVEIHRNRASNQDRDWYFANFFSQMALALETCEQRLAGPFDVQINRIDEPYKNMVHFLYANKNIFEKISAHILETFGIQICFDDLEQGQKDIRVAPTVTPPIFSNSREKAMFWTDNSPLLSSQGDGLKAYMRILFSLFNDAKEIIIIDEPESFLHSPQRRSLGKFIAENATSGKQIFISTHDSEFLRGILTNTSQNAQIIHLKNMNGARSYKINSIPISTRSQNNNELVLNSYFNKLTVLCEAEDDRMVYQYASQVFFPTESVDTYFLGQNAKSGVVAVFKDLIDLEINVKAIVDIDILYSGECVALASIEAEKNQLIDIKNDLNALDTNDKRIFKENGLSSPLDSALMVKVQAAAEICKRLGVYVVPVGQLESWMDSTSSRKRLVQSFKDEIDLSQASQKKIQLKSFINEVLS